METEHYLNFSFKWDFRLKCTNRTSDIQLFLDMICVVISSNPLLPSPFKGAVRSLVPKLNCPSIKEPLVITKKPPVTKFLANSIELAEKNLETMLKLIIAFKLLSPYLNWYCRQENSSPLFMGSHGNAQILGPLGLAIRTDVSVGVSLLAPNTQYPVHQHLPEEIYIVMSEGEWKQEDKEWSRPGYGGLLYNPSNVSHSMRSTKTPLLAVWCLNIV